VVSAPQGRAAGAGDDALAVRLTQAAMALVLTVVSVLLLITTHRMRLALGGVDLPVGLLFGGAFQILTCVFLYAATGSRLPLVVLGALWGLLAAPFLGRGAGGGVLLPAVIGEQAQFSGWIVQGLGVGIPFLVAAVITVVRRSASRAG
jgi:hypothetical protein